MEPESFAKIDHSIIRYSKVWEDYRLAEIALKLNPADHLLIVGSAGCNVLNLARWSPRQITCVDLSESQSALVELRIKALIRLDYLEFLKLLGHISSNDKEQLYEKVRHSLSDDSRNYWDSNVTSLLLSLQRDGRLDKYFLAFWQQHPEKLSLLKKSSGSNLSRAQRHDLFANLFDEDAFRQEFTAYFSRENMIAHGRHPIQFRYVDPEFNVGTYLWNRFQWAMTTFKIEKNPYMQSFLYGNYFNIKQSIPYLSPSVFEALKKIARRINIVRADLIEVITSRSNDMPNKLYLSNVFEYVPDESALCTLDIIGRLGTQETTACYWNFLVSRGAIQASMNHSMQTDFALSSRLSAIDRSWIYRAFWVSRQRRR